jgi:predicted amidophosphoribosyltransferase
VDAVRWAVLVSLIAAGVMAVLVALRALLVDFPRCPQCRKRLPRRNAVCVRCWKAARATRP